MPEGGEIEVPTLFDGGHKLVMPAYSIEAFLAEKTETVVSGFPAKTLVRLKDFYDIATVVRKWAATFDGSAVHMSFAATFERRNTDPDAGVFDDIRSLVAEDTRMEREWTAFKMRAGVAHGDLELLEALNQVESFAGPILVALAQGTKFELDWVPGSGWSEC